jgi:hypothetical protein
MTRRANGPVADESAVRDMMSTLAKRTAGFIPKTPMDKKLIEAGHLKPDERLDVSSGEIFAPSNEGLKADMERLKELTGDREPIAQIEPGRPNDPVELITRTPVVPQGYVAEPPVIEWLTPVRHANGEATQTSGGGQYAVFGRRGPQGFTFQARHGLSLVGSPCKTAADARMKCLLHFAEACGE